MKKFFTVLPVAFLILFLYSGFSSKTIESEHSTFMTLFDSIVAMDTKWEDAYNNCKMNVMEEIISDDLEFYHDQGGLMTSKQKLNEAFKNNICGKVKRVLKKGSIEVYEIKGYGAVEMGLHGFMNIQQQGQPDHYAKFIHLWKRENGNWRITRVFSLH